MVNIAQDNNINLTRNEIKQFYDQQQVNQIYSNSKINYLPTLCPYGPGACLQLDLMDINIFYKDNKPYKYLLNVIDVYSRFVWVFPLETKNSIVIKKLISNLTKDIHEMNPDVKISITTDNGKEFVNKNFDSMFNKKYMYKHYVVNTKQSTSNNPGKTAIIERFNRTLWNIIKKYTSAYNTLSFINVIPKFVSNYNNSIHSSIKQTPFDVMNKINDPTINTDDYTYNFEIGDNVRIKNKQHQFDKKSFNPKYSVQVYEIIDKEGNQYTLKNKNNDNILPQKYIYRDLIKIGKIVNTIKEGYDETLKKNKKYNKYVRKQKIEPAFKKSSNIQSITDDGDIIIAKKLQPKDSKRKSIQTNFY